MIYSGLADIYDKLTDDFDYDAWARYYAQLIRDINPAARDLIDCACGTGSLAVRLYSMGFTVTGVDISEQMLMAAAEKARKAGAKVRFICQDMLKLDMPRPADALICACDGVNYVLNERALDTFFARVRRSLKLGGAFAFDVSNIGKLRSMGDARFFGEDREDISYLWLNDWREDERKLIMRLTFFVKQADGRYIKFTETHVQRAHEVSALVYALKRAGFAEISVFGGDEGCAPATGGERAYISCRAGA